MTWRYAVLEIFSDEDGNWPSEGTPADWVHDKLIGWGDGQVSGLVKLTPLYKILWWKLQWYFSKIADMVYTIFWTVKYYFYSEKMDAELTEWYENMMDKCEDGLPEESNDDG